MKNYYRRKLETDLLNDTGMDLICCSCIELKSAKNFCSIDKIPIEKIVKFLVQTDLTQNTDGLYYVCVACKKSIDKDQEPTRCQKEILGFLSFPKELKEL